MNSIELYDKMRSDVNLKRYGHLKQLYREYLVSHCSHPVETFVYNTLTGQRERKTISCGHCYHCQQTKINEWVARMYYHLEDYPHVYFVTLTYRSISDLTNVPSRFLLEYLQDALWHLDDKNSTGHLCYNPCVLCKEHYQNFLKRLRKNTGADITYVLTGEYGTGYGRPHFHLILFSMQPITEAHVKRSWSLALYYDKLNKTWSKKTNNKNGIAYYFPFGRIDYNDLVANGSLDQQHTICIDGKKLNAGKSFAYVCKYVVDKDSANYNRVLLAYHDLFDRVDPEYIWNNRFEYHKQLYGWKYHTKKRENMLFGGDFAPLDIEPKYLFYNPSNFIKYDETTNYVPVFSLPSNLELFKKRYSVFTSCSTRKAIAALYADAHCEEFSQGIIHKPQLQDKLTVFPNYFTNYADKRHFSLRFINARTKSVSSSKGCLSALLADFVALCHDQTTNIIHFGRYNPPKTYNNRLELARHQVTLYDSDLKLYFKPYTNQSCTRCFAIFEARSSSRGGYIRKCTIAAPEFAAMYFAPLSSYLLALTERKRLSDQQQDCLNKCLTMLTDNEELSKYSYNSQLPSIIEESIAYRKRKQVDRDQLHGNLE